MCTIHAKVDHKYLPSGEERAMSVSLNVSKSSMVDPLHTDNELDLVGEETRMGERNRMNEEQQR
jgi:hypothetical protein